MAESSVKGRTHPTLADGNLGLPVPGMAGCAGTSSPYPPPLGLPKRETTPPLLGQHCSVSLPIEEFPLKGMRPVVGKFPIWLSTEGTMAWSEMPEVLPPFPGRLDKDIWIVSTSVRGDLIIKGSQVTALEEVLFPSGGDLDRVSETTPRLLTEPEPFLVVRDAHEGADRIHSPPGFQYNGALVLYPSPGCYAFVATFGGYETTVTLEVSDD